MPEYSAYLYLCFPIPYTFALMKVAIYGRDFSTKLPARQEAHTDSTADALQTLFTRLDKAGVEVLVYEPFLKHLGKKIKAKNTFTKHEELKGKVKFLFSIGGDGTFLETVRFVRDSGIPVVGINTGRLGFLSGITKEEIEPAVDALLKGKYSLDKRTLLELNIKGKYLSLIHI